MCVLYTTNIFLHCGWCREVELSAAELEEALGRHSPVMDCLYLKIVSGLAGLILQYFGALSFYNHYG